MDDTCAKAVRETFVNMYEKGLIYKGHRIINWCPHCTTALSDACLLYTSPRYTIEGGATWILYA